MSVVGAWHTGFQVADLDRSLAFYRDLLGFEQIWRRTVDVEYIGTLVGYPGLELRQAMLRIPGSEHCLELLDYRNVDRTPVDTRTANPGTAHICFMVDDLARLHRRLLAEGVEFVGGPLVPTTGPNVGKLVAYMQDPDGIRIELIDVRPVELGDPAAYAADGAPEPA
jgi:lactoylglutathione lyase